MEIVVLEPLGVERAKVLELAAPLEAMGHRVRVYDDRAADDGEMTQRLGAAQIAVIANQPMSAAVIDAAPALQYISVAFVGVDHIALDSCRRKNIRISNAAGYCNDSVAELAVGLTIAVLRNMAAGHCSVQGGGGKLPPQGRELRGKTVGIVGTGAIGCQTARLFQAFGCRVIGCSRSVSPEAEALGIAYMSLDELAAQADIISLHTPLTAQTRGMFGRAQLAAMKRDAVLINTARGPVVDTAALAQALREGRIWAGLDVYDADPPLPADDPLLGAPNLVCTPHIGFDTREAVDRRSRMVFENVTAWLGGELLRPML